MLLKTTNPKIIIFLIATFFFIPGFVLNITSDAALYQANLNVVPQLQTKGGKFLIILMNIVSNLFNPVLCAGYIIIIYLITSRKLEALTFLIWFIFLSWLLSVIKQLIHQPRPFWVSSSIQMLEWTCYIQYGSPSGHSMLAIVLLDFLVRFLSETNGTVDKHKNIFYVLIGLLQGLVMFSRIYLGMHTFNEVLFGFMLGIYSMIPYYFYMEGIIFKYCIKILSDQIKLKTILIMMIYTLFFAAFEVLITFAPHYEIKETWKNNIQSYSRCQNLKDYSGFYLKCFQDQILVVVIPAIIISFKLMANKPSLLKKFNYGRCSLKFLGFVIITIVLALIPVAIFLNPFWKNIHLGIISMAILLWFNNMIAFFLATICLVGLSTHLIKYVKLDQYQQVDVNMILQKMQASKNQAGSLILSKKRSDQNIEQQLL